MIRRAVRALAALIVSTVATLAAYLAFLGWDQDKKLGPDGSLHGPYQAWQVIAFGAVMGVIAAGIAWVSQSMAGAIGCTVMLTAAFSIDAATDAENDGLWPLGAIQLAIGVQNVVVGPSPIDRLGGVLTPTVGFLVGAFTAAYLRRPVRPRKR